MTHNFISTNSIAGTAQFNVLSSEAKHTFKEDLFPTFVRIIF